MNRNEWNYIHSYGNGVKKKRKEKKGKQLRMKGKRTTFLRQIISYQGTNNTINVQHKYARKVQNER